MAISPELAHVVLPWVIVTVTLVPPVSDLEFAAKVRDPPEGISTWKLSPLPALLNCS
jgi:hypothetical protein